MSQPRETVAQAVTHDLARYACQRRPIRSSRRPHHAGPYLLRRGRIYYFRKRLPRCGSNPVSNQFLCLSLRTDLPLDAVKRAARLLTVYEQKEQDIVDALKDGLLKPETAKAILTELLRAELARILSGQDEMGVKTDADLDARIARLEEENRGLRRAARRQGWQDVRKLLTRASEMIGLGLPDAVPSDLGRQAASMKRRINEVEIEVTEGEDVRQASRQLLDEQNVQDFDRFVAEPVLISTAFTQTRKNYPTKSM